MDLTDLGFKLLPIGLSGLLGYFWWTLKRLITKTEYLEQTMMRKDTAKELILYELGPLKVSIDHIQSELSGISRTLEKSLMQAHDHELELIKYFIELTHDKK